MTEVFNKAGYREVSVGDYVRAGKDDGWRWYYVYLAGDQSCFAHPVSQKTGKPLKKRSRLIFYKDVVDIL